MTLKQLEYFLAIAQTGHINAAAQLLGLTEPPVSAQLKALEQELDTELFYRDKHNLIITPAGQLLQKRAEQIAQMVASATDEVENLGSQLRGTIRIGAISSACVRILPERAAAFLRQHPNASFQLWEGSSNQVMESLRSGVCDIALIREPYDHEKFDNHKICDPGLPPDQVDPLVAVGTPYFLGFTADRAEIELRELSNKPLIIHRRYYKQICQIFRAQQLQPLVICQNNDLVSSVSWAERGIGVALMPATSSLLRLEGNRLITTRIVGCGIDSHVALISRKGDRLSALTCAFLNMLGKETV